METLHWREEKRQFRTKDEMREAVKKKGNGEREKR